MDQRRSGTVGEDVAATLEGIMAKDGRTAVTLPDDVANVGVFSPEQQLNEENIF